jgi:N utilization substance protein B
MTRGDARELAVHLIYSQSFTGDEPEQIVASRLEKNYYEKLAEENEVYSDRPKGALRAYIDTVVTGVINRTDELNAIIQQYSISWDVSRISRLARTIMQLAIYEIQYVADVPTGVAVSEAVRLAKKYDGSDTGAFVNGILGAYARSLNTEEVK